MKLAWATWAIKGKGMAGIEEHKSTQNPFVAIWFCLFHEIHQHHVRFGRGFLISEFRNWTHNQYNQHSQWPNECSLLLKAKTLPNGMSCQASKAKSVRLEVTKGVRFRQDCLTDFRSNKRQLQSVAENICAQRDPMWPSWSRSSERFRGKFAVVQAAEPQHWTQALYPDRTSLQKNPPNWIIAKSYKIQTYKLLE